ncbi:MAG: VOC family protein [Pseudomonadota bacterium]
MLDHTGIVVSDLSKARKFYDAIAKPLGLVTRDIGKASFTLSGGPNQVPYMWIGTLRPSYWIEGSRAGLNQTHLAFIAADAKAVDAFHAAALVSGGKDNGPLGPRKGADKYYGAFALDPDGNNIEACFRGK